VLHPKRSLSIIIIITNIKLDRLPLCLQNSGRALSEEQAALSAIAKYQIISRILQIFVPKIYTLATSRMRRGLLA
jgi:hypothetical protein